jgi:hypothetical protein
MQTPSPWATKADVEAAREELKADIAALHANLTAMHGDLRAVQALMTEQNKRRPWWRRLFAAAAVLMAVMTASAGARADYRDGNQLLRDCTSLNNADQVFCIGYVAAISDAAQNRPEGPGGLVFVHCPPENLTLQQAVEIVVRFLKARTAERRDFAAGGLVAHALAEAYPCK